MKHQHLLQAAAFLIAAVALRADTVETASGARLVGKIVGISGGAITLDTDYAGLLTIKQSTVTALTTDHPVAVRLASGTRIDGVVTGTPTNPGGLVVAGADGTVTTNIGKVAAVWAAGGTDPAVLALQRHWHYEVTADIAGTSGNKTSLSTGASVTAELITPTDALKYFAAYDRAVTDHVKSADQFKAGIDYADNFSPTSSWFIRDTGGFDRIMNERFFNVAATGYGFSLIHSALDLLTVRAGVAYQYIGYYDPLNPTVSAAAADFEISHDLNSPRWGELSNSLTIVPSLAHFSDVVATQDSFYQVPLTNPNLKLRLGVSNNYNSRPGPGFTKLDTLYYTRLVYDWGAAAK